MCARMNSLNDNVSRAAGAALEVPDPGDSDAPGLPLLRTWKGVYLFVLGCFLLWVGLLVALTVIFS